MHTTIRPGLLGYVETFLTSDDTPVSKYDLVNSGTTVATLFFRAVFGDSGAVRGLNFLVALSAFGNIIAALLGSSRMIRECGR